MRKVPIPARFSEEIARHSSDELRDFRQLADDLLLEGKHRSEVVDRMTTLGWSEGFSGWYVALLDENDGKIELDVSSIASKSTFVQYKQPDRWERAAEVVLWPFSYLTDELRVAGLIVFLLLWAGGGIACWAIIWHYIDAAAAESASGSVRVRIFYVIAGSFFGGLVMAAIAALPVCFAVWLFRRGKR